MVKCRWGPSAIILLLYDIVSPQSSLRKLWESVQEALPLVIGALLSTPKSVLESETKWVLVPAQLLTTSMLRMGLDPNSLAVVQIDAKTCQL